MIRSSMIRKSVLRRLGDSLLVVGTLLGMCCPESFFPGSTSAKAVSAPQCVKRVTSPISAMSYGPREGPTPLIAMTTGYSALPRPAVSAVSCCRPLEIQRIALMFAPILAAVAADGAVKEVVDTRIGLVE